MATKKNDARLIRGTAKTPIYDLITNSDMDGKILDILSEKLKHLNKINRKMHSSTKIEGDITSVEFKLKGHDRNIEIYIPTGTKKGVVPDYAVIKIGLGQYTLKKPLWMMLLKSAKKF